MSDVFNGYVTKYALTKGIEPMALKTNGDGLAEPAAKQFYTPYYHGEGREWHRTLDSAVKRAQEMQKARVAALRRELAKVEALDFTGSLTGKPARKPTP